MIILVCYSKFYINFGCTTVWTDHHKVVVTCTYYAYTYTSKAKVYVMQVLDS